MEFDLSKPQQLLRESAREVFARQCPMERVRALMAGESAFDEGLWRTLSEQGWVGLHLPESAGGLGLGLVELAVVVEEMGRACVPGPFLATLWAATLLADAGDSAAPSPTLESIMAGDLRATVALARTGRRLGSARCPAPGQGGGRERIASAAARSGCSTPPTPG